MEADLPDNINGLSCHVLRGGEIIAEAVVVSSRINVERKRFTLAHELAHRIICSNRNPAINLEQVISRFAAAFLIPCPSLRKAVGANRRRITGYEIVGLKHIYGVSAATLLVRLGQVGVLSEESVRHVFATFARTWRRSEPDAIQPDHGFAAFEKPRRFRRLVLRAISEKLISPVRAAALLNQPLQSIERQISDPATQ